MSTHNFAPIIRPEILYRQFMPFLLNEISKAAGTLRERPEL
jgi:hypothetical protein